MSSQVNNINFDRFEICPQKDVDEYIDEINEVLEILGHPEALVTDESIISDFICIFDKSNDVDVLKNAINLLGMPILISDYLVDVAKRLRKWRED
jgi:hypothetical protein